MRWRDDRDLVLCELAREGVLLVDLRVAPALGPVELGDDGGVVLESDLVDAVLVAVEAEQTPVRTQARSGDRVEHEIRRQPCVGVFHR